MSEEKSRIEKSIDKSLGIGNKAEDDFDMSVSEDPEDDQYAEDAEHARQVAERKKISKEINEKLSKHLDKENPNYKDDEDFTRDLLRDLAVRGATFLKIQEDEMILDPSPRNAETAATLITATTNAIDKLQSIGHSKEKLKLDEQKLGVKAEMNGIAAQTGAAIACTFGEMLKQIKNGDVGDIGSVNKPIDVESTVINEDDINEQEDLDAD